MKLGLFGADQDLYQKFLKIDIFTEVKFLTALEDMDVLIIVDKKMKQEDLQNMVLDPNIEYFYLLTEETPKLTQTHIETLGFKIIPPRRTNTQIVDLVASNFASYNKDENLFVFFGTDNKVGTTMLAQSVAEIIADNKELKVLLLPLGGSAILDYVESYSGASLEALKSRLDSGILTSAELFDATAKIDNLYILKNIDSLTARRFFTPAHIEKLLTLATKTFDLVVVDAGSNIEFGTVIGSLIHAKNKFLIATQNEKSISNFIWTKQQVFDPLKINCFNVVVNKAIYSSALDTDKDIARRLNLPLIGTFALSNYGLQAERDRKTLYKLDDSVFTAKIIELANLILKQIGKEMIVPRKAKLFGRR